MPEIRSSSAERNAKPWFRFTIMDGLKVRFDAANGLGAFDGSDVSDLAHLLGARDLALSSEKPGETHVLAVTLDGQVDFTPESEQQPEYYAHLAWYDPETDSWTRLNFVEGGA